MFDIDFVNPADNLVEEGETRTYYIEFEAEIASGQVEKIDLELVDITYDGAKKLSIEKEAKVVTIQLA